MKEGEISRVCKHILVHSVFVFVVELIKMFGLETILIYTALLLKKRIVVYHHSLEALLKVSFFRQVLAAFVVCG